MTLSRDTFGHDEEIGRLFEQYDRLVRWEEHDSRLDATDPVVERAVMRGRIVAFIANTATLQQDAHTSIAKPEPQDVEEARTCGLCGRKTLTKNPHPMAGQLYLNAAGEPTQAGPFVTYVGSVWECIPCLLQNVHRRAEREQQLVEALRDATRTATNVRRVLANNIKTRGAQSEATVEECIAALDLTIARAALGEERPA